jgi:hypothetical protein
VPQLPPKSDISSRPVNESKGFTANQWELIAVAVLAVFAWVIFHHYTSILAIILIVASGVVLHFKWLALESN